MTELEAEKRILEETIVKLNERIEELKEQSAEGNVRLLIHRQLSAAILGRV